MGIRVDTYAKGNVNTVLHVILEQDGGLGGELDNYVLIDPVDFGLPKSPTLRIMSIRWSLVWFDVAIKFGGIVPRPAWFLPRDSGNHLDFHDIGGLVDRGQPPPSEDNGKVLISTNGFATLGSQGALLIAFRK